MPNPTDRRYLETHEWHKLDGDVATIGITQAAADELTDHFHFLRFDQLRFQTLPFGSRANFRHRAAHRWAKPREALLEDVIRRAVLERIDGQLFAQ